MTARTDIVAPARVVVSNKPAAMTAAGPGTQERRARVAGALACRIDTGVREDLPRRIALNPGRKLRGSTPHRPERPWATAAQVNEIAARLSPANQTLVITAAYTGMRWGELAGLR